MSETELPAWADVATAADRLELASTPAELHGALCGWLAGGGADQPGWIATVMADPGLAMQQLDSSGLYAAPLVDGDTLYVQSRGGKLYAIKRP